jgi:hypothetical protein
MFISLLSLLSMALAGDYFHQSSERYKLHAGWREPGLWRPKWIMERYFDATEDEAAKKDRVYFKMKANKLLKIFGMKSRPKVQLFKTKESSQTTKKLFETGEEEVLSTEQKLQKRRQMDGKPVENDGSWWWQEQNGGLEGFVKIETREGEDGEERIRHDILCDFGKVDGYSVKFRRGKIFKYEYTDMGIPIKAYVAGSFIIKCNPHRPLISREFVAFQ